jgi:serine/threonine protein kinase
MLSDASTSRALTCPSCNGEILADVSFRQCPRCLLDLGLSCQAAVGAQGKSLDSRAFAEGNFGLEDYEILEQIGRGGMGVVYRARQRSLDRIVAVKMIRVGELASPAALARFRREAEMAAKLDHANIVPIYEAGEHEANPFLVMKLVVGASLAERLRDFTLSSHVDSKQPVRQRQDKIAGLMATVARAVHYAHERRVLHRDLKPSNILLDQSEIPSLTDFGIAKFVNQDTALTQTAELLGTPSYMAPEQAAGKPSSCWADIYSLGAILYELLTGRLPFEGPTPMDILRRLSEEEPTNPSLVNPLVAQDLATICLKCLDKDPAQRYRSALAFAEDLERWQRREPILARRAGPILRLRRWTIRNPALATLIVSLATGMALTLVLWAKATEEKNRKSIALAILRTETARQLQQIWDSPSPFFAIKSETLAAMAGMEPARLWANEKRFTLAFVSAGNPLDQVLGAAPVLEQVEQRMTALAQMPTRMDLRLYKTPAGALADLLGDEVDFMQMNARDYVHARMEAPGIQPLVSLLASSGPGVLKSDSAVIFTRVETGIRTVAELRGKSFLFGRADSTMTFWAKTHLVEAGIHAGNLSKYRYLDGPVELSRRGVLTTNPPALGNPFSDMTPVEAVLDGIYDAAVVTEKRFAQVAANQTLVLLSRFPGTSSLLVSRNNMPLSTTTAFQHAMTSVKDPHLLQMFPGNPSGFELCTGKSFVRLLDKLPVESMFDESAAHK